MSRHKEVEEARVTHILTGMGGQVRTPKEAWWARSTHILSSIEGVQVRTLKGTSE